MKKFTILILLLSKSFCFTESSNPYTKAKNNIHKQLQKSTDELGSTQSSVMALRKRRRNLLKTIKKIYIHYKVKQESVTVSPYLEHIDDKRDIAYLNHFIGKMNTTYSQY